MNILTIEKPEQAYTAMLLHYFAKKVLYELPENTGDTFGIGEDDFIMALYPYAELIVKLANQAVDRGKDFDGLRIYDAFDLMAECLVISVLRQSGAPMEYELPELDEFELDILRVIESH